jgi:microcystin-dependent protein
MKNRHAMKTMCASILLFLASSFSPHCAWADNPFLGEIRWVAFNFAPKGWAQCNGQLLAIAQNQALFSLLGTTFGGNGVTTLALPDLRSRAPIHVSPSYLLGGTGGEESHTLTLTELPSHNHAVATDPREGTAGSPTGNYLAKTSGGTLAYGSKPDSLMASGTITSVGNGQPHENMKPFIALNCVIAVTGIFPSRN